MIYANTHVAAAGSSTAQTPWEDVQMAEGSPVADEWMDEEPRPAPSESLPFPHYVTKLTCNP
jgi:hypothetical protein